MKEKYWLTFIFLCATFFTNAQDIFQYPDKLLKENKHMDAIVEYERIILNSTDSKISNEARYKKAIVYRDLKKYPEALNILSQVSYFGLDDSTHYKYQYQLAFCYYLNQNFNECESQLIQLETYIQDTSLFVSAYLLRALNYNELLDWEKANFYALKYINTLSPDNNEAQQKIEGLYTKKNLPKLKNEKLAEVLKYIPGFGQIYAGAIGEGLFNLSLNTASIYLGVNQVIKSFYVTGYFVTTIPVSKFYFGSRKRTDFLIEKKNYECIREFNDTVKTILID